LGGFYNQARLRKEKLRDETRGGQKNETKPAEKNPSDCALPVVKGEKFIPLSDREKCDKMHTELRGGLPLGRPGTNQPQPHDIENLLEKKKPQE